MQVTSFLIGCLNPLKRAWSMHFQWASDDRWSEHVRSGRGLCWNSHLPTSNLPTGYLITVYRDGHTLRGHFSIGTILASQFFVLSGPRTSFMYKVYGNNVKYRDKGKNNRGPRRVWSCTTAWTYNMCMGKCNTRMFKTNVKYKQCTNFSIYQPPAPIVGHSLKVRTLSGEMKGTEITARERNDTN